MGAYRRIPDFHKKDRFEVLGLAGTAAFLGGSLCCFTTIFVPKHAFSDWLGSLVMLLMSMVWLITAIYLLKDAITNFREKRNWFKDTATAQTTVVDRQEILNDPQDIDYAFSYGQYIPKGNWCLIMEIVPSQLALKPEETTITASISESQYKRYANRNTVRIYYSKEDPFVFLLEDEV